MRGLGRFWIAGVVAAVAACVLAGCGTPGAPQPPSLNLPERVSDLAAVRTGTRVELNWTMPRRNTDKLLLKAPVAVRVCRAEGSAACVDAGTVSAAPGEHAHWAETLPPAEASGPGRALAYFVELKNHNGRSAGLSNAAAVVAGAPPAPVEALQAEVRKTGVLLHWKPDSSDTPVRLKRTLLTPASAKEKENLLGPAAESRENSLRVDDAESGRALDRTARFGEAYEYRAQRVETVPLEGRELELPGEISAPVRVEVKDVFPPDPPQGLAAVAVADGKILAIDLSWQPNTEDDLAGYVVYRSEEGGAWVRISPAALVNVASYRDMSVRAGQTYRYAVTAVDRGGHESARSAEAEETAPDGGDEQ